MGRHILILLLGCLSTLAFSQDLKWIYSAGGSRVDYGNGLALDSRQNIYDILVFHDTISIYINENLTSIGEENVVIRKSTSLGIRQWYHQLGSKNRVIAHDIITDANDNVYVTGTFVDSLFYNTEFILKGDSEKPYAFLLKLSEEGVLLWAKQFTSTVTITSKSISILPQNDVVISGHYEGNANFGNNFADTTSGYNDVFLVKLDPDGNTTYLKSFGGIDQDILNQLISDKHGNLYLTGEFRSSFSIDGKTLNPAGQTDVFLIKLAENGDLIFAKSYGSSGIDVGYSVTVDSKKDILLTGKFSQTVNFGGTEFTKLSKGGTDIFLLKMDSLGNTIWVNSFGDLQNDSGAKVIVNDKDIIFLTGTFRGKVDFNPSITYGNNSESNGNSDIFYAMYNQDGTYNLHYAIGGMAEEQISDLVVLSNGDVISSGGFGATVDFEVSSDELEIFSHGGIDAFLLNIFTCINPYLKKLKVEKNIICPGENILIQVEEGYLNAATQWSWQRHRCNNITFASGDFLSIPIDTSTTFYVKGFGGCVTNDECQKIEIKIFTDSIVNQDIILCEGDYIQVGQNFYTTPGTYIDTLRSGGGCDSIIVSNISVFPKYFFTNNIEICNGDSIKVGSNVYTLPGSYTDHLTSIHGCDSTIVTHLSILPAIIERAEAIICKGDKVTIRGVDYNKGGLYIQSSPNQSGCTDMYIINIIELETEFPISVSLCEGESYSVGNNTYSTTGIYVDSLTSNFGCDSIITTNIKVYQNHATYNYYSICAGDSIVVNGIIYKERQYFIDSLQNVFGCDSIVFTSIDVLPPIPVQKQDIVLCEGDSLFVGTFIHTTAGIYTDTLSSIHNGCDSIVQSTLTILYRFNDQSETICEGQEFTIGDSVLDASGIYQIPLKNTLGCDSIVVLNLTVVPQVQTEVQYKICPGESIRIGSNIYNIPGIYTDTLSSVFGCDSIVIFTLEFNQVFKSFTFDICQGESITINNKKYSDTGFYTDTLQTVNGCDSILLIQITSHKINVIDTTFILCKGETIKVGNSTYSNNGKFKETLTTQFGCDSIINFEITVIFFEPSIVLTRDTLKTIEISDAQYQWFICRDNEQIPILGANKPYYVFSNAGNYAIEVTYKGCSYLSICLFANPTATIDASKESLPLRIYPNPVNEHLNVFVPENGHMRTITATGVILKETFVYAGENNLETYHLLPGLYFIEWSSSVTGKTYRHSFVKY